MGQTLAALHPAAPQQGKLSEQPGMLFYAACAVAGGIQVARRLRGHMQHAQRASSYHDVKAYKQKIGLVSTTAPSLRCERVRTSSATCSTRKVHVDALILRLRKQ